ncbi:hypothetical protein Pfo_007748 [Paulownia fortunei]|nr:hypothetical protein Pfo_007748 [Paulownia fortunei]
MFSNHIFLRAIPSISTTTFSIVFNLSHPPPDFPATDRLSCAAIHSSADGSDPRAAFHQEEKQARQSIPRISERLPIIPNHNPACKLPSLPGGRLPDNKVVAGARITGTLFGYRKGRVSLSIQENSRTLPTVVVELAMQTHVLQKEMSLGMVRIALECEKRAEKDKTELLEEPLWTMYCNGKKIGYGVKREANEEDLHVMEVLKAVSMGAGVLPGRSEVEGPDGEIAYMRAHFDRVVGSKDSETLYMLSPDGNNGPELSIFFVRALEFDEQGFQEKKLWIEVIIHIDLKSLLLFKSIIMMRCDRD